jgi:hypothetical protein
MWLRIVPPAGPDSQGAGELLAVALKFILKLTFFTFFAAIVSGLINVTGSGNHWWQERVRGRSLL